MRKCKTCHVTILDPTMICPLCHSVLETEGEQKENKPGMYPDVKETSRILSFVVKLYTFLAIVAEAALIAINYFTYRGIWWSAISGIAILYFYITLRYSIQKNSGYLRTILIQMAGAVLLAVAVDVIVGYRGWSVNYVFPSTILLMDLAIVILMLVNAQYWQSYILLELLALLLSLLALILWWTGLIKNPVVAVIAAAVSGVLFAGTLIFGDRRAKNELKRRFHM